MADLQDDPVSVEKRVALAIQTGLDRLIGQFHEVTRRARTRFEQRDWKGAKRDNKERIDLYATGLQQVMFELKRLLGAHYNEQAFWVRIKQTYADTIRGRQDIEQAETFYNSITRRIFSNDGIDPAIEFVGSRYERFSDRPLRSIYRNFFPRTDAAGLVADVLQSYTFEVDFVDLEADARLAAARIETYLAVHYPGEALESVEMLRSATRTRSPRVHPA